MSEEINRNKDRDVINNTNVDNEHLFPLFFKKIKFERFRHIEDLSVEFRNPITIISGSNKSGKTTILLSIACSHYNFKRRNVSNGTLERNRWGDIMRFTKFDKQFQDWTYYVNYKEGKKIVNDKRGQRKHITNKWNGVAKKESQIGTPTANKPDGGRSVILIDLERILPGRGVSSSFYNKIKNTESSTALSSIKIDYLSYVLEVNYEVGSILKSADKEIFKFKSNNYNYSSFNTASGEDVLSRIISDIIDTENNSLVLIEEIEIGLHPKIQRRLMDVIYHEAKKNNKQFIITTHSPTVLSSVDKASRVFIEKSVNGFRTINEISVNAAFSKMDSLSYPLLNLFIEDDIAEKIVKKAIEKIEEERKLSGFSELVNIIISDAANDTYLNFKVHQRTHKSKKIECGYACILDGDMRNKKDKNHDFQYTEEDGLFFLYSNDSPELFLVKKYLEINPNENMQYHLQSNPHCLFDKMVEFRLAVDNNVAFEKCWECFVKTNDGIIFIDELCQFLINTCKRFSPDL
ncbi:MAG TPA: AAA family ATPase [Paludibacter sp.]